MTPRKVGYFSIKTVVKRQPVFVKEVATWDNKGLQLGGETQHKKRVIKELCRLPLQTSSPKNARCSANPIVTLNFWPRTNVHIGIKIFLNTHSKSVFQSNKVSGSTARHFLGQQWQSLFFPMIGLFECFNTSKDLPVA